MQRARKTAVIVNANLQVQEIVRDEAKTSRKRKRPEDSLPTVSVGGSHAVQQAAKTVRSKRMPKEKPEKPAPRPNKRNPKKKPDAQAQSDEQTPEEKQKPEEKKKKTPKQKPEDPFQHLREQPLPEELRIQKKSKVIRYTPEFVEEGVPTPARIDRPRVKNTKVGAKPKLGHTQSPKRSKTTPEKRCAVFVGQGFEAREEKLYCSICFIYVAHRKQSHVKQHIKTKKHQERLEAQGPKQAEKDAIGTLLKQHAELLESSGKTLDQPTMEMRFRVMRALMLAGIPRSRFFEPHGELRLLMEELSRCCLAEKGSVDLVSVVCQQEKKLVQEELKNVKQLTLIFDGASEVSEVFAIVARYWCGTTYHQRLVKMAWVEAALDGQGEAALIVETLGTDLGIGPSRVFACVRDGASINDSCVEFMRTLNKNIVNVTCVSHISCRCNVFECASATSFISTWSLMIADSPDARLIFRALTGAKPMQKSRVKWFAEYEVIAQLNKYWSVALQIIDIEGDFASNTREQLRKIVHTSGKIDLVRREIALMFDIGKYLVKLCYLSEGDDVISPFVFSDLESAKEVFDAIAAGNDYQQYLPSLLQVCQDKEKRDPRYDARVLMDQEYIKAKPVAAKFKQLFYQKHASMLKIWQFCSLFFPPAVIADAPQAIELCLKDVDGSLPPALRHRAKLLDELPDYLGAARTFNPQTCNITSFWNKHKKLLPTWFKCLEYVALLSPSSAAAERVFAQLRRMFKEDQKSTLQDYKSGSMMIRYNKIQRDLELERKKKLQIELTKEQSAEQTQIEPESEQKSN